MPHVASDSLVKRFGFETKLLPEVLPTRGSSRFPTSRGCRNLQRSGLNLHANLIVSMQMFQEIDVRCSLSFDLVTWGFQIQLVCKKFTPFVPVSPCIVDPPPDVFLGKQCSQGQVHYPHRSSLPPRSHEDCTVPLRAKKFASFFGFVHIKTR